MTNEELWYVCNRTVEGALKRLPSILDRGDAVEIQEAGSYGIGGSLGVLGASLGFRCITPVPARTRRDCTRFDQVWLRGREHMVAFRFDPGIRGCSIVALAESGFRHKVLISVSEVPWAFERRDEARYGSLMRDFGILHVAPFWRSSKLRKREVLSGFRAVAHA